MSKWISIKDELPPAYFYVVLGSYDSEEDKMVWQIGRMFPNTICYTPNKTIPEISFNFWDSGALQGPFASDDTGGDIIPENITHWIDIPCFEAIDV